MGLADMTLVDLRSSGRANHRRASAVLLSVAFVDFFPLKLAREGLGAKGYGRVVGSTSGDDIVEVCL